MALKTVANFGGWRDGGRRGEKEVNFQKTDIDR
jgi:hypothetical protein